MNPDLLLEEIFDKVNFDIKNVMNIGTILNKIKDEEGFSKIYFTLFSVIDSEMNSAAVGII